MKVRDLVSPKTKGVVLSHGCGYYEVAVVASLDPFILISEDGDMKWSTTVEKKDFVSHGKAPKKIWKNVINRIKREWVMTNQLNEI